MDVIISNMQKELEKLSANPNNVRNYAKFHKDNNEHISLTTPIKRKVSAKFFKEIKSFDKDQILRVCEELLVERDKNTRVIVFDWAFRIRKTYKNTDFRVFEKWLKEYVDGWGSVDDFCTHAFGEFMLQFPEYLTKIESWARSDNKWLRRSSAVILIYPVKKGKYIDEVFRIADILSQDKEDLVQKGYGWMLKEASVQFEDKVFNYVMKNKKKMPRTALRYAIEKMSKSHKITAMEK